MDLEDVARRGLVLLGCGKMGSALLEGWLAAGLLAPRSIWVIDPQPSDRLREISGLHLNDPLPVDPAVVLIAVKPQMMDTALPALDGLTGGSTLFISIAAGTRLSYFESKLGPEAPIVRAMPNTPAAVGRGITAFVRNRLADDKALRQTESLLGAVGQTLRLDSEAQMDAVTALSGSGPAYVFLLIEAMAAAGAAEGLEPDTALRLARATVAGSGHLAEMSEEPPEVLRRNVTSPGGTTAAGLSVLTDPDHGLPGLVARAVAAAATRSRELGL